MRALVLVLAFVWAGSLGAAEKIIFKCGEPKGSHLMGIGNKLSIDDDGYSGIHPTFEVSTDGILRMDFPGHLGLKGEQEAKIIEFSSERVVAIETETSEVWLYVFYPTRGVVYMSRTGVKPLVNIPFAAVYRSTCTVE